MNEIQINDGLASLTQREKKFLVQLSMAYECAGKRLSDITLCVTSRMYSKHLKIQDEKIAELFLEARKISDIPTFQILNNLCIEKFRKKIKPEPIKKISAEEIEEIKKIDEMFFNNFIKNKKKRM